MDLVLDDGDNDFGDVGEQEAEKEIPQKDCILFVVDAHERMAVSCDGCLSPFKQALRAIVKTMQDRILGGDNDLIGVLLYGTRETKVPNDHQGFPHIFMLQELEVPSASGISALNRLLEANSPASFGHLPADMADECDFSNVLWIASMVFNTTPTAKHCCRKAFIITDNDNPAGASASARQRALTRRQDLQAITHNPDPRSLRYEPRPTPPPVSMAAACSVQDAHVWVEPFFFAPTPPAVFDLGADSFWQQIVSEVRKNYAANAKVEQGLEGALDGDEMLLNPGDDGDSWARLALCSSEAELTERLKRRAQRKRLLCRMALTIRPGLELSGCIVSLIRAYTKPPTVKLEASTNEEIKTRTMRICKVHGTSLQPVDLWRAFCYGGKWVYFEPWELKALGREDSETGMVLLGFKPRDRLKLYHNMKPASFWQPLETASGSSVAVEALVQAMLLQDKVAICRFCRSISEVRLVALLPQPLLLEPQTGATLMPCGFYVIQLPFAEDLRELKLLPSMTESEFEPAELDTARALVQSLRMERSPVAMIPNPLLHKHYSYLRAIATAEHGKEPTIDSTVPDATFFEERRHQIHDFKQAFELSDEASAGSLRTSKRPKVEKVGAPQSMQDWISLWQGNGLASQTVATLKGCCKDCSLPLSGNKPDLIARINTHFAERAAAETGIL